MVMDISATSEQKLAVAVWGGTFDPVHRSHVTLAEDIKSRLQFDHLFLMPARIPPHKDSPNVGFEKRAQMITLALQDSDLELDNRELERNCASYTVDSLIELRQQFGPQCKLSFCMGMDSLVNLSSWHRWQELLDYAHIIVVARPAWTLKQIESEPLKQMLDERLLSVDEFLLTPTVAGQLVISESMRLAVSSSQIRQQLVAGADARQISDLDPRVGEFIHSHNLYRSNSES